MGRALATIHPDAHCELDFGTPLELAVATILSAQTTDVRVNQVTPKLFARYPDAAAYAAADRTEMQDMLVPLGFFRNKTDSLMKLGQALIERHDGEVPGTLDQLVALPGDRAQDRQRDPRQRVRRARHHRRHPLPAARPAVGTGPRRPTR